MRKYFYALFILLLTCSTYSYSQISYGGRPYGLTENISREVIPQIVLPAPDYSKLKSEDDSVSSLGVPMRMGVSLPVSINPNHDGTFTRVNNSITIWRVNIKVDGATGLTLYFDDFKLAPGDSLFIYSEDKSHFIGAFTEKNNKEHRLFATEVVKGESIIVELVENTAIAAESIINISEVLVVYTPMKFALNGIQPLDIKSAEGADDCEVNINCSEGDAWQDQKNGVVKIVVKIGSTGYWCTGSVMNNTSLNFAPYILTADHCALSNETYATASDIARWVFYFRFESSSCESNVPPALTRSMTGAIKRSGSTPNGLDGSDFLLIELNDNIPNSYNPYYQGWNARNEISNSGVGIHHPEGDVKKISTYVDPLQISQWGDIPETHLRVIWSATLHGHGVTEGGSSGSPIFNSSKQVIGVLTGGESDCAQPNAPDYYGRLFYSWDKNGNSDDLQLGPWLDPSNTGLRVMEGSYNDKIAIAQFVANKTVVPVGSYITFSDLSSNNPGSWSWIFEGGTPSSSNSQIPPVIYYDRLGSYDVTLVVNNEYGTDSVLIENYIRVVPVVYPNPTRNNIQILLGDDDLSHLITVTNTLGKVVSEIEVPASERTIQFSFTTYPAGIYFVTVKSDVRNESYKIIYSPN